MLKERPVEGNPRDGYWGGCEFATLGDPLWQVSGDLRGTSQITDLDLAQTQHIVIDTDADWPTQRALRDRLVATFAPLGFVDDTLASNYCAGEYLDVLRRHDEAQFEIDVDRLRELVPAGCELVVD